MAGGELEMAIKLVGTEDFTMHKGFGKILPVYAVGEEHLLDMPETLKGKWSGEKYPPKVGDRVNVIVNNFGLGTVLDYEVRSGWLGVEVKVDKQPEWNRKQNGIRNVFTFFGAEITY
jgi:hypothetical protein